MQDGTGVLLKTLLTIASHIHHMFEDMLPSSSTAIPMLRMAALAGMSFKADDRTGLWLPMVPIRAPLALPKGV